MFIDNSVYLGDKVRSNTTVVNRTCIQNPSINGFKEGIIQHSIDTSTQCNHAETC